MNKKRLSILMTLIFLFSVIAQTAVLADANNSTPLTAGTWVTYQSHVENIGWQSYVADGAEAGTDGKSLRMEALKISLGSKALSGASITYQAHVQNIGWMAPVSNGAEAGTDGQGLRCEAFQITIAGMPGYSVQYRAHVQNIGWQDWQTTANGTAISSAAIAGTTGQSLRVEALQIRIVPQTANTVTGVAGLVTKTGSYTGISGASVTIAGQTATTDKNGYYNIPNAPVGTTTVAVSATNYVSTTGSIKVVTGSSVAYNVSLNPTTPDADAYFDGYIYDSTSFAPISGVKVQIASQSALTNSTGYYHVTSDTAIYTLGQTYNMTVSATGYNTVTGTATLKDAGTILPAKYLVKAPVAPATKISTISGIVYNASGNTTSGAYVYIYSGTTLVATSSVTTSTGAYSISKALTAGAYTVVADIPSDNTVAATSQAITLASDGQTITQNMTLQKGFDVTLEIKSNNPTAFSAYPSYADEYSASYTLKLTGGNLAAAVASPTNSTSGAYATDDASLFFTYHKIPSGTMTATFSGNYAITNSSSVTVNSDGSYTLGFFGAPASVITFAQNLSSVPNDFAYTLTSSNSAFTPIQGTYSSKAAIITIPALAMGSYTLTIPTAGSIAAYSTTVNVTTLNDLYPVTLGLTTFTPPTTPVVTTLGGFTGYVRSDVGPLYATVRLCSSTNGAIISTTDTDEDTGSFAFSNLVPATYTVYVNDITNEVNDYEAFTTTQAVTANSTASAFYIVTTKGANATVKFNITDSKGTALSVDSDNISFKVASTDISYEVDASTTAGSFSVANLSAGTYTYKIIAPSSDYNNATGTVTVTAGSTQTVTVALTSGRVQLSVLTVSSDGSSYIFPNDDLYVLVYAADGTLSNKYAFDDDFFYSYGQYLLNIKPSTAGFYTYYVLASGCTVASGSFTVGNDAIVLPPVTLTSVSYNPAI